MVDLVTEFNRARHDPTLAVLEGFHALKHATRFGANVHMVVGTDPEALDELSTLLAPDVKMEILRRTKWITKDLFRQLGKNLPHTEVLAIARRRNTDPTELLNARSSEPLVLLEDPRNLGNIGAVILVSAAAGAAGVLTTGIIDPWDPTVIRGSAGLHYAVSVAKIEKLPPSSRPLIAVDPDGIPLNEATLPSGVILAFGTERHGLSESLLDKADARVCIPMRSGVSSLNIATSVAVVLFLWKLQPESFGSQMQKDHCRE